MDDTKEKKSANIRTFFIFGQHPALARAELERVLKTLGVFWHPIEEGVSGVIGDLGMDPQRLLPRLGGTVKVGVIMDTANTLSELEKRPIAFWLKHFNPLFNPKQKVSFGFSIYDFSNRHQPYRTARRLKTIAMALRREMTQSGQRSRWVTSQSPALSSVIVTENDLIQQGADFCLCLSGDRVWLGRTTAVQDYHAYEFRDIQRPSRNPKRGMLPPKLAQILINLSGLRTNQALWDPFCGNGTVLMEAAQMGFRQLIGSDISEEAVDDTKTNLEWIEKQSGLTFHASLILSDIRHMSQHGVPHSVDGIVTEPYLGKPLTGREPFQALEKNLSVVQALYNDAFRVFHTFLKPGGVVAIILPVYLSRNQVFRCSLEPLISQGFHPQIFPGMTPRHAFEYARPGQHVVREIFVLKIER